MGQLKPDTTYIYEKSNGVTYAREFGADPSTRKAIGWDYGKDPKPSHNSINWVDLLEKCNTNPALHKAVDRAILIYQTIKEEPWR
jgi:hypothetical protein